MAEFIHDPVRRQRLAFSRKGNRLHAEVFADPGGDVPSHYHPRREERFEVLAGHVRFDVGGKRTEGGPGTRVVAPAGIKHAFRNVGQAEAHLKGRSRPRTGSPRLLGGSSGTCPRRPLHPTGDPHAPAGSCRAGQPHGPLRRHNRDVLPAEARPAANAGAPRATEARPASMTSEPTLYICWGLFRTPRPGRPCRNAYDAIIAAGITPKIVRCYGWGRRHRHARRGGMACARPATSPRFAAWFVRPPA